VGKALTEADQNIGASISDVGASTAQNDNSQNKNSVSITISCTIKVPKSLQPAAPTNNPSKDEKAASGGADGQTGAAPSTAQQKNKQK
jgi:hypothetical protein